ncbi:hypothetical protein BH10BAC3_BH10BAC3_05610 [soil metagenome]
MFFSRLQIVKQSSCKLVKAFLLVILISFTSCQNLKKENTESPGASNKKLEALPNELAVIESPDDALNALKDGHARYKNGQFEHIHIKRVTTEPEEEAHSFVAIIACTDFKIPTEILFDLDKQNILLLESPANTDDEKIAAVLKSANGLQKIKLVLVLGHSDCETIRNIVTNKTDTASEIIKDQITAAIPANRTDTLHLVENTVLNNIKLTMNRLTFRNAAIDSLLKKDRLQIKGAYYNVATGKLLFDEEFK